MYKSGLLQGKKQKKCFCLFVCLFVCLFLSQLSSQCKATFPGLLTKDLQSEKNPFHTLYNNRLLPGQKQQQQKCFVLSQLVSQCDATIPGLLS